MVRRCSLECLVCNDLQRRHEPIALCGQCRHKNLKRSDPQDFLTVEASEVEWKERRGIIYRVGDQFFRTSDSYPIKLNVIPPARPVSYTPPNLGELLSEQLPSTPAMSAPRTPARDIPFPQAVALRRMGRNGNPAVESSIKLGPLPEAEKVGGSA